LPFSSQPLRDPVQRQVNRGATQVVNKELTAPALIIVVMAFQAHADVIHLKSGKQTHFQKTWECDREMNDHAHYV
jgi:hypothetical protein